MLILNSHKTTLPFQPKPTRLVQSMEPAVTCLVQFQLEIRLIKISLLFYGSAYNEAYVGAPLSIKMQSDCRVGFRCMSPVSPVFHTEVTVINCLTLLRLSVSLFGKHYWMIKLLLNYANLASYTILQVNSSFNI